LIRGLVVILLSLALSAAPIGDVPAHLFVFIAGVFPVRALAAIAKRVNVSLDPEFAGAFAPETASGFVGLPSLDPLKVFALRAAGIQSTYDLAATPIMEIVGRVRIDPRLLGRAVDRAILIDALGIDLVNALAPLAITSATELVGAAATDKLGDAYRRAAARLGCDPRLEELQRRLGCTLSLRPASASSPTATAVDHGHRDAELTIAMGTRPLPTADASGDVHERPSLVFLSTSPSNNRGQ
jgi:hypothetical protein